MANTIHTETFLKIFISYTLIEVLHNWFSTISTTISNKWGPSLVFSVSPFWLFLILLVNMRISVILSAFGIVVYLVPIQNLSNWNNSFSPNTVRPSRISALKLSSKEQLLIYFNLFLVKLWLKFMKILWKQILERRIHFFKII